MIRTDNRHIMPPLRATALGLLLMPVCVLARGIPVGGGTVEWQLPLAPVHPVQTRAQDATASRVGRPLPRPEVLQPSVDLALKRFSPRYSGSLTGTLRVMCSDTMPALVRAWIHSFTTFYPHVDVILERPYEGDAAAQALRAGRVDVAFVSRELRPVDVRTFRAKYGYPPTSVPVSGGSWRHFGYLDAIAIIVNPENPLKRLSLSQLDAVLSRTHLRGDIPARTWGDLGATGAWASRPIHVYGIQPWNGFEEFVRERVLDFGGRRGRWRRDIHFAHTVFPIAQHVADDPDAIGYTGLAFLDAAVKVLAVGPKNHAFSPTYTNVALARYPLSRLLYANINLPQRRPLAPALQEFLRLILSRQGQNDVRQEGVFLPLRAFQARAALHMARLTQDNHS